MAPSRMLVFVAVLWPGFTCSALAGPVLGDFNGSGARDPADIDLMTDQMLSSDADQVFDLNGDGRVGFEDRRIWIEDLSNTFFGDANFDGEFNSSDFVAVFRAAKYETGKPATFTEGDQLGDGLFNSADFITAFFGSGYEFGPRAGGLMVVSEPSSCALFCVGLVSLALQCRKENRRLPSSGDFVTAA